MSVITTSRFTEKLSRRLQRAGRREWVAESSGDAWGRYLIFRKGGRCLAGCGWTQREAEAIVNERVLDVAEFLCDYLPTTKRGRRLWAEETA